MRDQRTIELMEIERYISSLHKRYKDEEKMISGLKERNSTVPIYTITETLGDIHNVDGLKTLIKQILNPNI